MDGCLTLFQLCACVWKVNLVCSVDLCGGLTLCDVWMNGGLTRCIDVCGM